MTKKILVLLSLALLLSANLRAQVTIGELVEPAKGALLDLNKAVKGGLTLSNVKLDNLYTIPTDFPGMSSPPADVNTKFTGAMVYHTGENNIAAGIYVWNGTNWAPVTENCLPLTAANLTLAGPPLAKVNTEVSFSASANTSAICSGDETYSWSVTPATNTVQTPSAAKTSITFTATGTYTVKVVMANRYTDPAAAVPAEKEMSVTVSADGRSIPQDLLNHNYGLAGKVCLDVKKSKQPASQDDVAFVAREDAFSGNSYTKTYKFIHGDSYSNLSLSYEDDANAAVIDHIVPPAVLGSGAGEAPFTVVFRSDVKNLAPAKGDSLTVKLMASYKDSDNNDKLTYLEIRVEDGTCVCPAKISATKWLNFMCHNLGGEDILSSSQLITRAHHGNWYRFGAASFSMENVADNDDYNDASDWSSKPVFSTTYVDWPVTGTGGVGNPCPAGWRLPDIDELAGVINFSRPNSSSSFQYVTPDNNTLAWLGTWSTTDSDKTNFSAFLKVGDHLYLPAAGYRTHDKGQLINRAFSGQYWSSTFETSVFPSNINFQKNTRGENGHDTRHGLSVRCVAVE
jgi:uncharacterized protein (TIGR02145 family)